MQPFIAMSVNNWRCTKQPADKPAAISP